MKRPSDLAEIVEYLTFGRQSRLLFRVWTLQIVLVFFEVQALRGVHPAVERQVGASAVAAAYAAVGALALFAIVAFVHRMSRLTFAATFRSPLQVGLSLLSYLVVAGGTVVPLVSVPGVPPSFVGGATVSKLSLVPMVTVTFAALLAVGFYALFDLEDSPSRREIRTTLRNWVRVLDWVDEPEGSQAKRERYTEFRERTAELSRLLEYAVTEEGGRLRDDFEDWLDAFRDRSPLSQEAIVRGNVRNERLERHHEELIRLVERFERIQE
ncbi:MULTISPECIES: hypothetical protein [Halorussus]|uniref:hypothetical protein n=1 Tax=Halorussus TaxID=1070314 RepID=UPI00209F082E|nr:hypothetical protein [Halorussus vallis]USZ74468.1 hypothetical protein NGM07_13560 [Halorussus vallis]